MPADISTSIPGTSFATADTQSAQPLSMEEFGQRIKAKYPQYGDMQDADVGQKMLARYPQYQDMVRQDASQQGGGFLSKLQDIFAPAKETGNILGGWAAKLGLTGLNQQERQNVNTSDANYLKAGGEVAQNALTIGTLGGLGTAGGMAVRGLEGLGAAGEGLGAAAKASAKIGAGFGAASTAQQDNPTLGSAAMNIGLGAAGGMAMPFVGAGLSKTGEFITDKLPQGLVQRYFPMQKDITQHLIENTPLHTPSRMLSDARENIQNIGDLVEHTLGTAPYDTHIGEGAAAIDKTLQQFPNSKYTPDKIIGTIKKLVPDQEQLVDKVAGGTATLLEKNTLRSAIDSQVKTVYNKISVPTARNNIGATFAGALRTEVQSVAPETVPMFDALEREITLRNGLMKLAKRSGKIGLNDIAAAAAGGAPGIAMERAATSPTVALGGAKLFNLLGKAAPYVNNPTTQGAARVGTFDILSNLNRTNQQNQ